MAGRYCATANYNLPRKFSQAAADSLTRILSGYDIIVAGLHGISSGADSFALTRQTLRMVDTLTRTDRTILALFGTPYALNLIPGSSRPEAIVVAYQDNPSAQESTAEVVFGGLAARGKLPVTAAVFSRGTGEMTDKTRLGFILPGEIGIPQDALVIIDSIAMKGIEARAYPGCQVLFVKDGKVFYSRAFGNPRYEDTIPVTPDEIYDLASVTKTAATTVAVMKLWDEHKLNLDDSLGKFLPTLRGSNKSGLSIRNVMAHQSGLQPWIPFYKTTLKNGKPDPEIYQSVQSDNYPVRVAEFLFIRQGFSDSIFREIINSPLRSERDYKYSDLGFYLLRLVVENITNIPFATYLDDNFYRPMGLQTMGFNPRHRFDLQRLIPTEFDTSFRKQLIRGDVHDPGAAMLGGVSGHAGLFSDSQDLAAIFQMLLQGGEYGGKRYLSEQAVKEFTRAQFSSTGNRRGLGFDKPLANYSTEGPSCKGTSARSFGHSGFTGTYVWADPENQLVYVFLSNRVYPSAANAKITEMNIRTSIHQAMYNLLGKYHVK
jgi:CubicO group peptidase (beta-lactamase class C family)